MSKKPYSRFTRITAMWLALSGCACLLQSGARPALGSTWVVDKFGAGHSTKVQTAIDLATTGDTVIVNPGTYFENIDFLGKDLYVRSAAGASSTILDGSNRQESVVQIRSGESQLAVLEGFTLQHGVGSSLDETRGTHFGGGILIQDSEPTIQANRIVFNGSGGGARARWGGGVYCETRYSSIPRAPIFQDNYFGGNEALVNGGGIGIVNGSLKPTILRNRFEFNTAVQGDGGAIWIITLANGSVITKNLIDSNHAGDHGGGVYVSGANLPISIEISQNIITRNTAHGGHMSGDSGGGMWLAITNALVLSNTLAKNSGQGADSTWGGGIALAYAGSPRIERNIIACNTDGGGVRCWLGASPTYLDNIFWGNAGGQFTGDCQTPGDEQRNVFGNPYFCDPGGGVFSVATNSPALTHPAGPIGAIEVAGCPAASVVTTSTWSSIKVGRFK